MVFIHIAVPLVMLTGCREGNCHNRLGVEWAKQRLAGERDPYLRERVPRERVQVFWSGLTHNRELGRKVAAFQDELRRLPPYERGQQSQADR